MRASTKHLLSLLLLALPMAGCAAQAPITPVGQVDLPRYMGDWYVIASIPTRQEEHSVNAVESYVLLPDGRIQTTFRYRVDTPAGEAKTMHATGYVRPGTANAVWGMQFIWPIKAQYVIAWIDPHYQTVIVARDKRDYVWIMARTPTLAEAQYQLLATRVAALGYDPRRLRRTPQQWPAGASDRH